MLAQSAWAIEYINCISVEGYDSLNKYSDMTLINLMVRPQ